MYTWFLSAILGVFNIGFVPQFALHQFVSLILDKEPSGEGLFWARHLFFSFLFLCLICQRLYSEQRMDQSKNSLKLSCSNTLPYFSYFQFTALWHRLKNYFYFMTPMQLSQIEQVFLSPWMTVGKQKQRVQVFTSGWVNEQLITCEL